MTGTIKLTKRLRFHFLPDPALFISGGGLLLVGNFVSWLCGQYSIPDGYDLNAFDIIFIIPMLCKMIYYELAASVAQLGAWWGTAVLCIGIIMAVLSFFALERSEG